MKKTVLFFIFLTGFVFSQELKFEEVVQADGLTAKQLYDNAILWAANQYRSSNEVLQVKDPENFVLLGKGGYVYKPDFYVGHIPATGYVWHTFKISCKDGRYKYEIYNFNHEGTTGKYGNGTLGPIEDSEKYTGASNFGTKSYKNKVQKDAVQQTKENVKNTVKSLKNAMIKTNHAAENW